MYDTDGRMRTALGATGIGRRPSEITPGCPILVITTPVSPELRAQGLATVIGTPFQIASRWERRP